jgi:DNA (cytosine-5)-methyltransferase 1
MRVLSLFSGIGGLDLGFERQGFEVLLAADSSRAAVDSYNRNLRPVAKQLDLASVSPADLPPAEVIVGGPPCQSFSLVGRRREDDDRGRLVFAFLEAVRELRPLAFVMENVPGIESSSIDGERLISVLGREFERAGYGVAFAKVLATDFMVPQRRRRFVMVGQRLGQVAFPDPKAYVREVLGVPADEVEVSAAAAISDLGPPVERGSRARYGGPARSAIQRLLREAGAEDVSQHEAPRMSDTDRRLVSVIPPGGNYMDVPDELATPRIMRFKETGGRTTTYGRLHPARPAYTINTYFRRPNVGANFHYAEERLITPREAMRFQALPDRFELSYGPQDERNALIGNAVPPLLAEAFAWALRSSLATAARSRARRRAAA